MHPHPDPQPPDLAPKLPRDAYYQLVHMLRTALPPVTDAPEDLRRRDNAAIAQVAALLPANIDEVDLAAQYVAARAHAMECFRLARKYYGDPTLRLKCTAQAASMLRQARATRSLLQRVQAERQKREADTAALDKATCAEHAAIGLMAQALADAPPATTAAPPASKPPADIAAEADRYALNHRKRAALIRTLGRLPDKLDFGPLSPQLVRAIVTGTSPILQSLDQRGRAALATAA